MWNVNQKIQTCSLIGALPELLRERERERDRGGERKRGSLRYIFAMVVPLGDI